MGLIQQMKKQGNMTERERDICNYILEHPELVESISSRELGHATFTSAECGDDRAESNPGTAAGNRGNKEGIFLQPACTGGEVDRGGELCGFLCV